MKLVQCKRPIVFLLTLSMVWGLFIIPQSQEIYADVDFPQAQRAVDTYYGTSQNKILDDWEELAAIYAYLEGQDGNDYSTGVDISDYVLPSTGTGAGGLFTALMKGDAQSATILAQSLVSDGAIVDSSNLSTYAFQVLALEAYNRSAGIVPVVYSTTGAIDKLLAAQDAEGGYSNPDWYNSEIFHNDYDSAGLALAVFSLTTFSEYENIATEKSDLLEWIKAGQSENGTFSNSGFESANSTAIVLYGLSAAKDLINWTTSPAIGLVNPNLYTDDRGWFVADDDSWNAYATKQATLALSEASNNTSFYANIELNSTHYISTEMQLIKPDGSYLEEDVTVLSGSDLNEVASIVSGSAIIGGFTYYEDGASVSASSFATDGSTILAVADNFTSIVYFSHNESSVGVPFIDVDFEESASFILEEWDLADTVLPQDGIPIDTNEDGYSDIYSNSGGVVNFTPLVSENTLMPIASDYFGTYISTGVAILPAYVRMAPAGTTQTKTVSVRVEGPVDNITYYSAYDVVGNGTKVLTAEDAVSQVLTTAGKSYTCTNGYLSEINGIFAGSYDPSFYDGWLYYMNGTPGTGLAGQTISNGDEIVVYYGYYPGFGTDLVSLSSSVSGSAVTLSIMNGVTPVSGVTVNWNGLDLSNVTDTQGEVVISDVSAGTYAVQIAKADIYGVPQVIRFTAGTTVIITSTGETAGDTGSGINQTAEKVFLRVTGLNGATMLSNTGQTYYVGITARDVLDNSDLSITGSGNYVSAINGLAEFEYGPGSGWLYTVNEILSGSIAASDYELDPDDEVLWYYTSDYTADESVMDSIEEMEEELLEETITESSIVFADVHDEDWYASAVQRVVQLGFFKGLNDSDFGPECTMTREMFVTVLGRMHEFKNVIDIYENGRFGDVVSNSYYENYISWAFENGMVAGLSKENFGIQEAVTREQMAVFMYRYFKFMGLVEEPATSDLVGYNDVSRVSDWAKEALEWAVSKGFLLGKSEDTLDPLGFSTRAEVAMFIIRCFNSIYENTI